MQIASHYDSADCFFFYLVECWVPSRVPCRVSMYNLAAVQPIQVIQTYSCHQILQGPETVKREFSNATVYSTSYSKHHVVPVPSYLLREFSRDCVCLRVLQI